MDGFSLHIEPPPRILLMALEVRKPDFAVCEQKSADQPELQRSLISPYVIRFLESVMLFTINDLNEIDIRIYQPKKVIFTKATRLR